MLATLLVMPISVFVVWTLGDLFWCLLLNSLGFSFETSEKGKQFAENIVGPILPGPPRLLDFRIEGDVKEGGVAKVEADYIGGYEGASEYWWMRIYPTGQRTQITQPTAIPAKGKGSENDPRNYKLTKGEL